MNNIIPLSEEMRSEAVNLVTESWGAPIIVTRGRVHTAENLPGFIAVDGARLTGLITYDLEDGQCEIVCLESLVENQGIGAALIGKVVELAKQQKCRRVWLITTNDNTHAIRYYQNRGFRMVNIHIDPSCRPEN